MSLRERMSAATRSMSLRGRVTLAAGVSVLLAVAMASVVTYFLVQADLRRQIDESLQVRAHPGASSALVGRSPDIRGAEVLPQGPAVLRVLGENYVQLVRDGEVVTSLGPSRLPLAQEVLELARAGEGEIYYNARVEDTSVRVRAAAVDGAVLMFGRGLSELEDSLRQLALRLTLITAFGVVVAMAVGRVVAATAVRPVHRLSDAAELVARTGDLSHHITESGSDELARLARSFNAMLDALEASIARQRQLVADASHELRTPLASLRTNAEVLRRADELDPTEREQLRHDVEVQLAELSRLVENLVELARGDLESERTDGVFSLDEVVRDVTKQVRRQHPSADLRLSGTGSEVRGSEAGVRRAVANLLDNAVKWSPQGSPIEVELGPGSVTVTDRGPGIDPEDLPHVFDRFYRSERARGMPGSGLGLAIVKQVATSHGGSVQATNVGGGGARLELRIEQEGQDVTPLQRFTT